ncbi:MAG: DUF4296 domain-containing protein [Bacteroidota bacterium]|jgi:hypothetical protein|nr:DUF4296 domain-containing protein [Terrimonas sp.]
MRSHLAAMIILVATCGCQSRQAIPSDILSADKMEEVLFDMLRSGHMVNNFILSKDSSINKEQVQIEWLNKVLTFHAVSEQQFKKSFSYYQQHPELMAKVMDSISKKEEDPLIKIRKPGKALLPE